MSPISPTASRRVTWPTNTPIRYPTFGAPLPGGANTYGGAGPGGAGWVRIGGVPAGSGIVRPATGGAAYAGPTPRPGADPAHPAWPAPTLASSERELHVSEAERGLHEAEREADWTRKRYEAGYATSMSDFDRQTREESDAYNKGLALLAESFTKLGTQQTEASNKAGLLQGGALLQSAATRAANEGKERTKQTESHTKAQEGIDRARAKLVEELAPPDAGNPYGGIKWQELAKHIANLASNFTFLQQGEQQQAWLEAAPHMPATPSVPKVKWSRNANVRTRQMREIQAGKLRA